jgi:hypothetical protein
MKVFFRLAEIIHFVFPFDLKQSVAIIVFA